MVTLAFVVSGVDTRRKLIGDASIALLESSLDYRQRLAEVARLAVPEFADRAAVHLVESDNAPDPQVAEVILTSRSVLSSQSIRVPLLARQQVLGVLSFHLADSGRHYGDEDLAIAEEVARRAALALDQAQQYQAAQEASLRLSAVLEQMPAGVMIADAPSGRVLYANRAASEIFRGPVTAVPDTDGYEKAFTAWHPDGRTYRSDEFPLTRAVAGETVQDQEVRFLRADGNEGVVRANAAPIRDGNGRLIGAVTAYYDATELKRATEERERLYGEAQRAIRSRDDLLAVVSHDLRNPLGSIVMAAGMLERVTNISDPQAHKTLKHLATISRAADRMERLISDLLDLASIEAGRLSIQPKRNEVGALLRDVGELMEPLASQKLLQLKIESASTPAQVLCDRERVMQVFSNLIGNAIKFTPDRGHIQVRASQSADSVEFVVADSGPGIPEAQLGRIFERYWQGKESSGRGVGLGLAITKGIVEAHRGAIWVHSSPGQGAAFHFTLPLEGTSA
jgi:signal transduction histidine kinase